MASLSPQTSRVRLLKPPPVDVALAVLERSAVAFELRHQDVVVAESQPAVLQIEAPAAPDHLAAVEASRRCPGLIKHPYPSCFVCGPERARGDGLRIFPGMVGDGSLVAAPWLPDPSLAGEDGKVRPEFMWAALDCPGFFAANPDMRPFLLAEFTAHVDRLVHIDEPCTVIGWRIGGEGRKHEVGTAVFDDDGELCGRARALWIEPRPVSSV